MFMLPFFPQWLVWWAFLGCNHQLVLWCKSIDVSSATFVANTSWVFARFSFATITQNRNIWPNYSHFIRWVGLSGSGKRSNHSDLTRPKTPKGSWGREIPLVQGNIAWWNIIHFGQKCIVCQVILPWTILAASLYRQVLDLKSIRTAWTVAWSLPVEQQNPDWF